MDNWITLYVRTWSIYSGDRYLFDCKRAAARSKTNSDTNNEPTNKPPKALFPFLFIFIFLYLRHFYVLACFQIVVFYL